VRLDKQNPILLVSDPGRPSVPVLAGRFLRAEATSGFQRLARTLGFQKLHAAVPEDWMIPDSGIAVQAIEAASAVCPPFIIRHSFRSYCFGAILAARNKLKLDKEAFFLAAILHDLGVSDRHADDPGSFEWVGARLAYDFCLGAEQSEERAALVHNAIALHTSLGVAGDYQPEIALLHFGTGMDLFGMRLEEIPKEILQQVLSDYPRGDFKNEFTPCLQHQADAKPQSQIAGAIGIGILDRVLAQLI
jgi:HD domain